MFTTNISLQTILAISLVSQAFLENKLASGSRFCRVSESVATLTAAVAAVAALTATLASVFHFPIVRRRNYDIAIIQLIPTDSLKLPNSFLLVANRFLASSFSLICLSFFVASWLLRAAASAALTEATASPSDVDALTVTLPISASRKACQPRS